MFKDTFHWLKLYFFRFLYIHCVLNKFYRYNSSLKLFYFSSPISIVAITDVGSVLVTEPPRFTWITHRQWCEPRIFSKIFLWRLLPERMFSKNILKNIFKRKFWRVSSIFESIRQKEYYHNFTSLLTVVMSDMYVNVAMNMIIQPPVNDEGTDSTRPATSMGSS